MSSSSVATVSNVGGCWAMAAPMVSVPSIGDAAAGSTVIMKNVSQSPACSKPAYPSWPIGSSAVPSKQKYAFASASWRW